MLNKVLFQSSFQNSCIDIYVIDCCCLRIIFLLNFKPLTVFQKHYFWSFSKVTAELCFCIILNGKHALKLRNIKPEAKSSKNNSITEK